MKAVFLLGASGSGKSSLATHLFHLYTQIFGNNAAVLVNLDPANHNFPPHHIDLNDLITIDDVMEEYQIGPNGAIIYSMEFLLQNIGWLLDQVEGRIKLNQAHPSTLLIFDLPGQIQLYVNSDCIKKVIEQLSHKFKTASCILQMFDSTYMHDINQFVSICLVSLATLINLELPHINVLNKVDMLKGAQNKPSRGLINEYFSLSSAEELVAELKPLQEEGQQTLTDAIAKVIDTYGQVSFMPGSLFKPHLVGNLIWEMEKAFGTLELSLLNEKFRKATADCGDFYAHERAMCELESELEEGEGEEEVAGMRRDVDRYG